MGALISVARGALSLLKGMKITIGHFFRKPVTVEYPHEQAPMSPAQRNAIVLIEKDDIESHNCIACLQCEKICPSNCISITGERPEGLAMKRPVKFDVNFALCSECGLCLDVCPTETLGYSKRYDHAGYHRDDFLYDILGEWRDKEEKARENLREADRRKKAEREAKRKAELEAKARAAEANAKEGEGAN
jgi:NADH-quinone oxidoreductase chain I